MPEAPLPCSMSKDNTSMAEGESGCQGQGGGGEVFESPFNTGKMGKLLLCIDPAGALVAVEKEKRKS